MALPNKLEQHAQPAQRSKGVTRLYQDLSAQSISSGLISGTLAVMGPPIIILQAALAGQFTNEQTISWMFAVYFFGGLLGIVLPLIYRIPITGAHSISGVAFLATITPQFTYPELIGGYLLSGLLIFIVGLSGIFTKIIKWVPKEVIAAMLGGLVASYVVSIVPSVKAMPLIGGLTIIVYFTFSKWQFRVVPPVLAAVIAAIGSVLIFTDIHVFQESNGFFLPTLQAPEFTMMGFVTLAVPLALLILSNDAAPGIGALETTEFQPPIRKIVAWSGIASMFTSVFGGQSANVAGMMTAICASEEAGVKQKRYTASIVSGIVTLLFGLFAWAIVPFIQSLPKPLVALLAGLALIGVLQSSLKVGFANPRFKLSALTAFVVALSNVSFFHISAPVWALILGAIIAKTVEK